MDVIQSVQPVFGTVRSAVGEQNASISELAQRATEASGFVERVSERAQSVDEVAQHATDRITQADQEAIGAANLAQALAQRFVAVIRHSEIGDRRKLDRLPVELQAMVRSRNSSGKTRTIDISVGGVLVECPQGLAVESGTAVALDIDRIGGVPARVVGMSPMGLHCAFVELDPDAESAVRRLLAEVETGYRPLIERAQNAVLQAQSVLEQAVADGRLTREQIFDTNYRPIRARSRSNTRRAI